MTDPAGCVCCDGTPTKDGSDMCEVCFDREVSVAALFVLPRSVYFDLPSVDPWTKERDARTYPGPFPVIAHPPCERWGKYWSGGPSAPERKHKGDDGGCFAAALWAVRTFGGVLEHPQGSAAWPWFGLLSPTEGLGWTRRDSFGGASCSVEQGHYGHLARKPTWLYSVGPRTDLFWGAAREDLRTCERLSKRQRASTPEPFALALLALVNGQPQLPEEENST